MAQAAIPLMIISAVVGAAGTITSGLQNASVFKAQAREEEAQGVAERDQIRAAARAAMGRQVMAAAESGFSPGFGSALTELEESLVNREVDLMTSKRNASTRAAGLRKQAGIAKTGAFFGAAAQLLGGGAAVSQHKAEIKAAEA